MSERFLIRGVAIVGCVVGPVALVFGVPLALTLLGIKVDAGVFINALAATVALGAAVVAYQAVGRQIAANADNVTRQIRAQTEAVSRQIESDRFERRRAERYAELKVALAVVAKLDHAALSYEYFTDIGPDNTADKAMARMAVDEFRAVEIDAITRSLRLLGLRNEADAVEKVYDRASQVIDPLWDHEQIERSEVKEAKEKAEQLLYAAMDQDVGLGKRSRSLD